MDSIYVRGGIGLCGKVKIQGSKNAALPILAATILTGDRVVIQNCPKISDVYGMVRILESLGCKARWEKDALALQTDVLLDGKLPREDMGSMRSSIFLLGSLLGRTGHAELTAPGGCVIGKRPIDIHIQALEQMGFMRSNGGGLHNSERGCEGAGGSGALPILKCSRSKDRRDRRNGLNNRGGAEA